jgi:acetylornithine deacetylase/succinyl-diaminopimelate desuccinylase-like protein
MNKILDHIQTHRDDYIQQLKGFLAIPSISALPDHAPDVRRCAEWCVSELQRIGLKNAALHETPGHPIVYAEWLGAPGAPTMLFYGHYDVQPVDPIDLWESPPFEATVREGAIYARGSADDKGQIFMHLKAIEATLLQSGTLPINVKVILEGEEEVGSVNLDNFIAANKEMLKADVVVISDSPMFDRDVPSICYGLRGLAYFQIDVRGSSTDLHSGSYGGAVANPAIVLTQLLAQMKDKSGKIKIPGFYDAVVDVTEAEKKEFSRLPFNEKRWAKEIGLPKPFGETGYSTLERKWARPTFEVNGLLAGFTGDGEGQHAPRAEPGPGGDRQAVRGLHQEAGAEDRRGHGDAHARRQALDHGLRQRVGAGGGPGDREGLRAHAGVRARGRVHSGRVDVPGSARVAERALRHRPAGRERARAERVARPRQLPQRRAGGRVPLRRAVACNLKFDS